MEIKIGSDTFLKGVQKVQGVVESKGAMPILSHLLLSAGGDGITLMATDLEISIRGFYPAKVVKEGAVTLNARKLFDILKELPAQEVRMVKEENDWVTLTCGKSRFRLPGLPAADYPKLPEYSESSLLEFTGSELRDMIKKTVFAISPDETRQALNGLLLEMEKDKINLVGTDGHRLALIKRPAGKSKGTETDPNGYLLPKKVLSELMKSAGEDDASYKFSVKDNQLAFIQDQEVIISRKVDGKFPNYRQVIPGNNTLKVKVSKEDLSHALKRVALLADEKSKMVRFEIRSGNLTLISDNTELGAAREEIGVDYDGDEVTIGLNARYVLDVLAAVEGDHVILNLKDENHSCLITADSDADYLSIVMPMRL